MRVEDITIIKENDKSRIEASVIWEDTDKKPLKLYFETDTLNEIEIVPDSNSFLLACLFPAMSLNEKRLKISGNGCPVLLENAMAACKILKMWYSDSGNIPEIEFTKGFKVKKSKLNRTASFLSCGIDSLALLYSNKIKLPENHPLSIKYTISIHYEGNDGITEKEEKNQESNRKKAILNVCRDVNVTPIIIKTNIFKLSDGWFFTDKWHGATMCSVAYLLNRYFNRVYIASSFTVPFLVPWGSHPLLDPYFSSAYLDVVHQGIQMTRLEKIKLVSEWPVGLQNIIVCQGQDSGENNCGTCRKCIGVMTALEACGKLKVCNSFPEKSVSRELLYTLESYKMIDSKSQSHFFQEMVPVLEKNGRDDLAGIINFVIDSYKRRNRSNLTVGID